MTIKELIAELSRFPETAEVKLQSQWGTLVSVTGCLPNNSKPEQVNTVIIQWNKKVRPEVRA
jgi:hypothetical protein